MNLSKTLKVVMGATAVVGVGVAATLLVNITPGVDAKGKKVNDGPTNLVAVVTDDHHVELSWDAATANTYETLMDETLRYNVTRRARVGTSFFSTIHKNEESTSYIDESITESGEYVYRVMPVRNGRVRNKPSNSVTALVEFPGEAAPQTARAMLINAMDGVLKGCVAQETTDSEGYLSYTVNSDDVRCVPQTHLRMEDVCLVDTTRRRDQDDMVTVYRDSGGYVNIIGHLNDYSDLARPHHNTPQSLRGPSEASPNTRLRINSFVETREYTGDTQIRMELGGQLLDHSLGTTHFEGSANTWSLERRQDLATALQDLHTDMQSIMDGEETTIQPLCVFGRNSSSGDSVDPQDRLHVWWNPAGVSNYGAQLAIDDMSDEVTYGSLDRANDIDLFEFHIDSGAGYEISVGSVDASMSDLEGKYSDLFGGSSVLGPAGYERILTPKVSILDANGEIRLEATMGADEYAPVTLDVLPLNGCHACFLKVEHRNESDRMKGGIYAVNVAREDNPQ
jgi:hypothetical protein